MPAKIKCRGTTVTIDGVSKYTVKQPEKDHPRLEVYNGGKRIASFHHWSYIVLEDSDAT